MALRYKYLEPDQGLQQAGDDYITWFFARLRERPAFIKATTA